MLKWTSKFKYGGSVPEGLDRIDSASTPRRETQSCRIRAEARSNPTSPKSRSRKTNTVMYRSQSEFGDRRHSYENDEQYHKMRQQKSKSAILENLSSPAINNSPFVNLQYEDLYKRFEHAHSSAPSSPQLDTEDINLTPKTSRQTSTNSLRRNSPANLPCIEEAAENDELLSIADSGICDEDYDHKKHYFEPCKFGDELAKNQHTENELYRKHSPCPRSMSLPTIKANYYTQKLQKQQQENSDDTDDSSDTSSESLSFDCPRSSSPHSKHLDIDSKNQELYSRLKADLESTAMGKKSMKRDTPHSLISSMLWKGNTSNQPPSSTGIYTTVPPNRYGSSRRNQDLMSQLNSTSSTPSTPSSPSSPKSPGSPREFKVSLDVSHYAPDEILVTLEDGKLVVNGKHFAESEYGFESLQFHRRYPIPDGIKKADIKSTITDEGILVITGRVNEPIIDEHERIASPVFQRSISTSGQTTPEIMLSGEHNITKLVESPSLSRRSIVTSDYSEDSRSRLSEDSRSISSNLSDNDFQETPESTFMLTVNCRGYDPQDLDIKIQSRELIIHGRQKICSVENGHERVRHKEFNKRYAVPRNANCHQIMSRFTEDEQLVVEIKKNSTIKKGIVREDILDDE